MNLSYSNKYHVKKVKQVLFRILRDADLLTVNGCINPTMLSSEIVELLLKGNQDDLLLKGNQDDLLLFPIFESDLKRIGK